VWDLLPLLKQSRKLVDILIGLQKDSGPNKGILVMADVQK
jgi:unspecific monooxygenase